MLAEADYLGLFVALVVLIGLAIGGYYAVSYVRGRLKEEDDTGSGGMGFGLADLREMLAAGQITEEEFEKAKHNMVASLQRKANEEAAAKQDQGPKHHPVPILKDRRT